MRKVIQLEICQKLKFDHTNKWYQLYLKSVLENETHKVLWDFVIQTGHLILARQRDFERVKKKENQPYSRLTISADQKVKFKGEKKNIYLDLARELKMLWNMKLVVILFVIGSLGTNLKGLAQGQDILKLEDRWRPFRLQHY